MENKNSMPLQMMVIIFFVSLILIFNFGSAVAQEVQSSATALETFIVHVKKPEDGSLLDNWHNSFIPANRVVYSYRHVISGFAAKLTAEEVEAMKQKEGFISARPQRRYSLHTTHSPSFLGLHQNFGMWKQSKYGERVIIGVFDTGVTTGHPSFSDEGMPPPPTKWKGKCEFPTGCNNKLIGARNFVSDSAGQPPVDDDGHGTHTSSTATGNFVQDANVFGNANGTAVGMAPLAHLAMYKVCGVTCLDTDILAAMDAAIDDGVDVLSLSLGGASVPFYADSVALGAFAAIQKGIFVSCSAANGGPGNFTLSNEAPWILTVGASTIDRTILATAKLGNGHTFDGESLFQPNFTAMPPLVYAGAYGDASSSAFCASGSLKNASIQGKVVLCERGGGVARIAKGQEVKDNGGAAMILMNQEPDGYSTLADAHVLPATHVSYAAGVSIKAYIKSSSSPTATILFEGTQIGKTSAPEVSSFSSRGPNLQSPGILKPDIIGPGVSILAAWPVSVENETDAKSTFNMISGTSMSCPHLSGIAAVLKSSHPDWSPAAIKSAIMTTADLVNLEGSPIVDQTNLPADIFATGAGHVNPSRANDPGLIYDIQPDDYIPYLCGLNYTDKEVESIVSRPVTCANISAIPDAELNYPSFSILLGESSIQEYTRTVTNVGLAYSSYTAELVTPEGVSVALSSNHITFSEVNQKVTYSVQFRRKPNINLTFSQGHLKWVSPQYNVTSPIVIIFE
ncbi:hypothetical protein SLEP1_g46109 [Rubroshorea leprosula]|uniref:Uncharacterized protein n=1 Tax=Rubroshorea leprosula TaxID=152421 RepID=A0AAV5LN44_9ROSI|nr:hypothetical protein SLEP1_g46109 [Rubroshorea leprosula]